MKSKLIFKLKNCIRKKEQYTEAENKINIPEHGYLGIDTQDGQIILSFENEDEIVIKIGEKINEINEDAYMNGYNWDAFFRYYLAKNAPDILNGMKSDTEAGSYTIYFKDTAKNKRKAKRLAEIIVSLIENEEDLYRIIREKGHEIKWDN